MKGGWLKKHYMSRLIVGSLVYNEEHKFLQKYLDKVSRIADELVLIDDGSTDNSLNICKQYTNNVFTTNHLFEQNESQLRQLLWRECCNLCKDGDFIFILDCDELLTEPSVKYFHDAIRAANDFQADGIALILYDMWNETQYREEPPYWTASQHYWVRCVRYKKNYNYYWNNNKLHCGSLPINTYYTAIPTKLQIQHMAYSTPELRQKKVEFYNKLDPQAQFGIKEQYDSILSENPILKEFKNEFEDLE